MGRPPLTPEQKAQRDSEKAALNADKRTYNRKQQTMETTAPAPANQTPPPPIDTPPTAVDLTAPEGGGKNDSPAGDSGGQPAAPKFKPFAGSRINRVYSTPKVDPTLINTIIPEAPMATATASANPHDILNKPTQPQPTAMQQASQQLGTNTMQPMEQLATAEQAVDAGLMGYDQLWSWAAALGKMSESKLMKKHQENKLNMYSMFIPKELDPRGRGQTVLEFAKDLNKQVAEKITLSPQFVEKVRPALIRLAQKYKIGLKDEYFVIGMFIKDSAQKSAMIYQMRETVNMAFERLEKNHETLLANADAIRAHQAAQEAEARARAAATASAQQPPQNTPPPPDNKPAGSNTPPPAENNTEMVNLVLTPDGAEGGDLKKTA